MTAFESFLLETGKMPVDAALRKPSLRHIPAHDFDAEDFGDDMVGDLDLDRILAGIGA